MRREVAAATAVKAGSNHATSGFPLTVRRARHPARPAPPQRRPAPGLSREGSAGLARATRCEPRRRDVPRGSPSCLQKGCRRGPEPCHVEGRHRAGESLERQLPESLGVHEPVDRCQDARRRQDLAGLRLAAETEGKVRDGPDRAVVPATLEPDGADRGVALGDPDADVEVVTALAPAVDSSAAPSRMARAIRIARSCGFGTGTGSLKKIIRPSPAKRSSVPSWARISSPSARGTRGGPP